MKGREAAKQRSSEGVRGGGGVAKRGSETIDNISICRRYRRNYGANIYYNSGNVGIGTNNPGNKLDITQGTAGGTTGATCFPLGISAGAYTANGNGTATLIGLATYRDGPPWYKCAIGHCRTGDYDRGSIVFCCNNVNDQNSVTMSDERLRITSTGNVGIGTATVNHKLHVEGTTFLNGAITFKLDTWNTSTDGCNRIYFGQVGQTYISGGSASNGVNICIEFRRTSDQVTITHIRADGTLMAYNYANFSDSRIKKDIEDINDDTALNKLLLIQPKTYNYIDVERNKGFGKVYGFIAQQIREVIPEATTITPSIIPNIYKSCLIHNKREVYHSIPLDVATDTEVSITIDKKGERYKIKEIHEDYFVIDKDIDADEAFVYGYNVDDVILINKDYIFTLNVCATQELHRRIEAQSVLLKSQDDRIKDLETKVEMLINSMNA